MGIRYYLFEQMKEVVVQRLHLDHIGYGTVVGASMGAAVVSQAVTYPLVVCRRVQQSQNVSAATAFRTILRSNGVAGFYRGCKLSF
jgi:hypothetical protein